MNMILLNLIREKIKKGPAEQTFNPVSLPPAKYCVDDIPGWSLWMPQASPGTPCNAVPLAFGFALCFWLCGLGLRVVHQSTTRTPESPDQRRPSCSKGPLESSLRIILYLSAATLQPIMLARCQALLSTGFCLSPRNCHARSSNKARRRQALNPQTLKP